MAGGDWSLASGSAFIMATKDSSANSSGFFLETGPVADQSFANGASTGTATLYVGGSDYSSIYVPTGTDMSITANSDGLYDLESVGFGKMSFTGSPSVPSSGFFENLGYPNQAQAALIATNFKGMGLPSYLWYQMVNLLYKVDSTIASELFCDDNNGGKCRLINSCANYSNLWSSGWSFKVKFTGENNYVVVPIAALAVDYDDGNNQYCDIWVQFLDSSDTQSDNVIFGSLINQLFA